MSETDRPRVAVFGTRTLEARQLVFDTLDRLTAKLVKPIILTGAGYYWTKIDGKPAKVGADVYAEEWACQRYHTLMRFHPDFDKYKSPQVFHVRNSEMIQFLVGRRPCYAVGFHDGTSPGTRSVIALCKKFEVDHLKVIKVKCPPVPNRAGRARNG